MDWLRRAAAGLGSADDLTIIILLVGEASGVFAGFCPSWFTVSSPFFHEQEAKAGNVKRIRWGEVAATGIVLATGAAVSLRTGRPVPFVASAAIAGIFVGGYEFMIAHPATGDDDGDATSASGDDDGASSSPVWARLRKAA